MFAVKELWKKDKKIISVPSDEWDRSYIVTDAETSEATLFDQKPVRDCDDHVRFAS